MTTVRLLKRVGQVLARVEGKLHWAALICLACSTPAFGQDKAVHWRHEGAMPPGAIGRLRLMRGGPLSGYCQPVEIRAPQGARIAPAVGVGFSEGSPDKLLVGLQVGGVYRFRVTDIPEHPGVELFPTIELVDRMYPPAGLALKFPVPIDLTQDELLLATEGRFITRIVYVEDPQLALPVAEKAGAESRWTEVRPGEDPLVTADGLGRPIAIVRIGGRVPEPNEIDAAFLYGSPPVMVYDRQLMPTVGPGGGMLMSVPTESGGVIVAPHQEMVAPEAAGGGSEFKF